MKRRRLIANAASGTEIASRRLGKDFFAKNSLELSKALLGKIFARRLPSGEIIKGTIVETEAYRMDDPASHSYNGRRTQRNEAMYMGPGHSYVYFTYGMYHCFNIAAQDPGSACLIRGVEPIEGISTMRSHRERARKKPKVGEDVKQKMTKELQTWELANGPGKLCLAFDLTRDKSDRMDLSTCDLMWLEEHFDPVFLERQFEIEVSKRIGIDSTPEVSRNQLWRFHIKENFSVSTIKPGFIRQRLKLRESEYFSQTKSQLV